MQALVVNVLVDNINTSWKERYTESFIFVFENRLALFAVLVRSR